MTFGATPSPNPRPPRSRARRFVPLGIAAWMVLEIWLLTVVAGATNGLTVFLLLVAGVLVGGAVIKRAGRRAWRNLTEALQTTGTPDAPRETGSAGTGNTLPMIGGLLLILPGLLSDVLGLLCLLPPTGRLILRRADKLLTRRPGFTPGSFGDAYQQARMHRPDGKVVQGQVIHPDDPPAAPREDPPLTR
ncbi:FxsA family membrane protein [Streptomyces sp. NPDC090442]|uniref:FxsA family membrane protein n=1 Tax=Streptomyces sp. NPDC090442 TaxID=3365962 RepID=UPI0037F70862